MIFILFFLKNKMIFPVRCFTCNKVIGNKWYTYKNLQDTGIQIEEVFKRLGIDKFCCKRHFTNHIEIIDELLLYTNSLPDTIQLNSTTERARVYECL